MYHVHIPCIGFISRMLQLPFKLQSSVIVIICCLSSVCMTAYVTQVNYHKKCETKIMRFSLKSSQMFLLLTWYLTITEGLKLGCDGFLLPGAISGKQYERLLIGSHIWVFDSVMYAIGHIRPHSVIVTNSAIPSFITRVLAS